MIYQLHRCPHLIAFIIWTLPRETFTYLNLGCVLKCCSFLLKRKIFLKTTLKRFFLDLVHDTFLLHWKSEICFDFLKRLNIDKENCVLCYSTEDVERLSFAWNFIRRGFSVNSLQDVTTSDSGCSLQISKTYLYAGQLVCRWSILSSLLGARVQEPRLPPVSQPPLITD